MARCAGWRAGCAGRVRAREDARVQAQDGKGRAKKILTEYQTYLNGQRDLRHKLQAKLNELVLTYLETKNPETLKPMQDMATTCALIGDTITAEAILQQFNTLTQNKKYNPEDTITFG